MDFILRLKDLMSGGIAKMGANSRSVFHQIDQDINKTRKGFEGLGKGIEFKINTSGLERAGREVDRLNNKMQNLGSGGRGGGAWDMFRGSLAARGVERGLGALRDVGGQALGAGMDAEQQIIGLSTFIGKEKAKGLYAQLQKESALTPFTTSNILPGMLQLVASGQNVEKSKKDLWALMNALSASGNAGNSFALELGESHLAQMAAAGKVDAYFMKEFQRTLHIPMTKLLSDYTGTPMKTIAGWSESGELKDHVTYDMFVGALDKASKAGGMFAGALEAQSQTIKGKASTIKDWWNIGLAKSVLDPKTHDNITKLEDRIIGGLESFPELIGKMSPVVNKLFDEFNELWPSVEGFGSSIIDLMKPVGEVLMSPEFKNAGKGLLDFATEITKDALPAVKLLAASFRWLASWLPKGKEEVKASPHGYIWNLSKADSFKKAGFIPDEAKMRSMMDSIKAVPTIGGMQSLFFKNIKEVDSFNRNVNAMGIGLNGQINTGIVRLGVPFVKGGAVSAGGAAGSAAGGSAISLSGTVDEIVGGGGKQIIINVRSFAEHFVVNSGNLRDAAQQSKEVFMRTFLEVLQSADAAM